MNYIKGILSMICGLLVLSASIHGFHKYHSSLTVMEYNENDKLIEITIQLFTHDLGPVLERQTGKRLDLEKTANGAEVLLNYLNDNFILNHDGKSVGKLVWVGQESKVDRVIVYVEIPYEGEFENFELKNTIFFESFQTQTNLVTIKFGESKADLVFKLKDTFKEIQFTNVEKK